jgi:hypothetical protein
MEMKEKARLAWGGPTALSDAGKPYFDIAVPLAHVLFTF